MKSLFAVRAFAILILFVSFCSSCKKDKTIRKTFQANTSTSYRVSPVAPAAITINGNSFTTTANFPGKGTGTATDMSTCNIYFNQLAYSATAGGPPAGSVAAAVTDISGYTVTGAPLPLIQAGDHNDLSSLISSLSLSPTVNSKILSTVLYDNSGNAVYLSAITGTGGTTPISATVVGFNGKATIIGGHGKFSKATGELDYSGYFNVANANDAQFNIIGTIEY
jgi:hypothetical protein